jgi:diketogulonate reductase-like aldo/keto reductase
MDIFDCELRDGHSMPRLGLGTWQLRGARGTYIVKRAIELGYRLIDTADAYGNHEEIREALKGFDRSNLFITTKVRRSNLRYHDVIRDCNRSLRELGTEYVDLYLIHWPNEMIAIQETLTAFNELVDDGKIRSIGVSNFTIRHLKDALQIEEHPLTNNQVRFHLYDYDQALLAFCKKQNIIVTAYSPLGRGRILHNPTLQEMARKYHQTPAQICLRWCIQKGVAVIPKTSSEERLKENMDLFDWEIAAQDMLTLEASR